MLPDLLWRLLLIAGIENVAYQPAVGAARYLASWYIPFSHGLVADILWAGLFAAGYFLRRHNAAAALVLDAVLISHWVLDAITDRNLPIAPGLNTTVGLDVWASLPWTFAIEAAFGASR
jgi:hypothetical protein